MFGVLCYGAVQMSINRILQWKVDPVSTSDDAQYLYNHITFTLELILNPVVNATAPANSAALTATGPGFPGGTIGGVQQTIADGGPPVNMWNGVPNAGGAPAFKTFANLQHALMQKRLPLRIYIGPPTFNQQTGQPEQVLFLQSPEVYSANGKTWGGVTDAFTGPNPLDFKISTPVGFKTAIVQWKCETWVNACKASHFVLANQFTTTESFDQDNGYLSRIAYQGEATFHLGRLLSGFAVGSLTADQFREAFFFPVPLGYQRTGVRVSPSSDGSTLRYAFVDEQQTFLIQRPWITKIRGRVGASLQTAVDINKLSPNPLDWFGALRLPLRKLVYEFEVWGTPLATMGYLASACVQAAVDAGINFAISNTVWDIDLHFPDRYAVLHAVTTANGILGGIVAGVQGFLSNNGGNGNILLTNNDLASVLWSTNTQAVNANTLPAVTVKTELPLAEAFSAYYVQLLSQALQTPCSAPAYPGGSYPNKFPLPENVGQNVYLWRDMQNV
jgi:hypothetical protein